MDNSLHALCDTIKKVIVQLKPKHNELSFVVMTGKTAQGKSALLKQSSLEEAPVLSEDHAKVYFNQRGIIVELGETWLINSNILLLNTLKQLNKCNRYLKITGLILCVDVNELLLSDANEFNDHKKAHTQLLKRFGANLGYPVDLALIFTKMDTLAGFTEFYQTEHDMDLAKPLGFSLDSVNQLSKKSSVFNTQFTRLIENQGEQVIQKMHPARSTIKRSLIREFPLQLASLRAPILTFLQGISPKFYELKAIYFTSAEQGGMSVDRINKRIQHEYALVVQDTYPQATNYRAYFVEGALKNFQTQCQQAPHVSNFMQKLPVAMTAGLTGVCLMALTYHYYHASSLLDDASKELMAFDVLTSQQKGGHQALYHLSLASDTINKINANSISLPTLQQLKVNLHHNARARVQDEFIPSLVNELELSMTTASNTPIVRYKALKIYLMLNQPKNFNAQEIVSWFKNQWSNEPTTQFNKKLALLKNVLKSPLIQVPVKAQIVSDARNYLNALPATYLYYSIAKEHFPVETHKISIEGFALSTNELPVYYTKSNFKNTISLLSDISEQLKKDNWILAHQDTSQIQGMLTEAYCYDYVTWWQTFMRKTQPVHYQNYEQGKQVTHQIQLHNGFTKLVQLIQQETKPDLTDSSSQFNQAVASKFADINLLNLSVAQDLNTKLADLENFIATLSVLNDEGQTAFNITKTRFANENSSDPISQLYIKAGQLPTPLNLWVAQIAGDTWTILIKGTRAKINQHWKDTVYQDFAHTIAGKYPFDNASKDEINIADFNRFFSTHGTLNAFTEEYIKPFLDVTSAQWKPKALNDLIIPISNEVLEEIIRANVITNMFFPNHADESQIQFSLQKISLDPIIDSLQLQIGKTTLADNQNSDSYTHFTWPQSNVKLALNSIEGHHYELAEQGTWALFKLLEKVNVLVDEQDSSNLQILFEVNGNSGRYLLKTTNPINPFTPGILHSFALTEAIV